jgi:CRP-like cAMP-binding protein
MPDQNLLLRALPIAVFDAVKSRLRPIELNLGHVLFSSGDAANHIYFPVSGAISLVTELADGEMVEFAMIGHDSVLGASAAFDDRNVFYKAIVQIAGKAFALDIETARRMVRDDHEFRNALVRHEQNVLAQSQQAAACNAKHNLNERLARWLLRVRDVTASDSFHLTQEFIAEMLGVGRTSVSIVAHTLQQAGMISYSRGNIKIDDLEALRDTACECYDTIKAHYDRLLQGPR